MNDTSGAAEDWEGINEIGVIIGQAVAHKLPDPELHYVSTVWLKHKERNQQRQPIRERVGQV